MSRLALGLSAGMTLEEIIECVRAADRGGYETVFVIESYADQYALLGACARETTRIRLATGVTTVYYRTPTSLAVAAATVDELSGGRFVLGLGTGHREIVRMRDDVEPARPLPYADSLQRLRETVEAVRAVAAAAERNERVSYRGEIFEIRDYLPWIPVRPGRRIPVYFGSFFEAGWELAGEIADGVVPIFMPLPLVERYVAAVHRGAERAGRDPGEVDIGCYVPCCVDEDEERARLALRHLVAFHMSEYRHYQRWFANQGHAALVERVGELVRSGELLAAARLVPDDVIDSVAVAGTPEQCRAGLERYRAAGVALPVVYPIHPGFTSYLPSPETAPGTLAVIERLAPDVPAP